MGSPSSARRGFTLIELLLVVGIIAILASIVIVAINPTKQLGDTRNAQRKADVNTILSAVYQYSIDNNGSLPAGITTSAKIICQSDMSASACTTLGGVNLSVLTGSYVVKIPKDPQVATTGTGSNYWIVKDSNNRITVTAPGAEQGATISITR
jgi:prepilin-type N-terminal cleavage/methylation domain-containing protein